MAEALATALPGRVADPAASLAPPLPSSADPGAGVQAGVWSRSEAVRGRGGPSRPAPSHFRSSSSSQLQVQLTYGTCRPPGAESTDLHRPFGSSTTAEILIPVMNSPPPHFLSLRVVLPF